MTIAVVMGVSGSGKTTVAEAVAERLGWEFGEGDDLHPQANRDKMSAGEPLTDADRAPWLERVRAWIDVRRTTGVDAVVTCSALKRSYRDVLRGQDVLFVLLDAPEEVLEERIENRRGHFMPVSLLESQLATLERPGPDEHAVVVDASRAHDAVVEETLEAVRAAG